MGGGPNQHSWATLACVDQSKASLYILQIWKHTHMHKIKIQGVTELKPGATKINYTH